MSSQVDTNQTSEVRKALITAILSLRHAEIATRPSSAEDADRAFESAVQYISDFIRTEKLKLLAEVREQTTIFKIKAHDKKGQPHLYEAGRGVPTEVLAKLEAEL